MRTTCTFYYVAILKSLSFYAPITPEECHAWFYLNASPAGNTEQVKITTKSCS